MNDDFMKKLSVIMEDSEFRNFFNEYFNNWDDIKAILMIMKMYQLIKYKHNKPEEKPLQQITEYASDIDHTEIVTQRLIYNKLKNPDEVIKTLRTMMNNKDTRKKMVDAMESFMK